MVNQKIRRLRCRVRVCTLYEVLDKAKESGAIPFGIPIVEHTHYQADCTFDYILKRYKIKDEVVHKMAVLVRGTDTDSLLRRQ